MSVENIILTRDLPQTPYKRGSGAAYVNNLLQIARDIHKTPYGGMLSFNIVLDNGQLSHEKISELANSLYMKAFDIDYGDNSFFRFKNNSLISDVSMRELITGSKGLIKHLTKSTKHLNPDFKVRYSFSPETVGSRLEYSSDRNEPYSRVESVIVHNKGAQHDGVHTILEFRLDEPQVNEIGEAEGNGQIMVNINYDPTQSFKAVRKVEKAVNKLQKRGYSVAENSATPPKTSIEIQFYPDF